MFNCHRTKLFQILSMRNTVTNIAVTVKPYLFLPVPWQVVQVVVVVVVAEFPVVVQVSGFLVTVMRRFPLPEHDVHCC